jgi:GSH-dependent disulfide-bond oxidoreductase
MAIQTLPIDLFYDSTPNGRKITIMLEELGVPYVVNWVAIGRGEQFRPEFLAISPNGKIPAIVDPEGPGGKPISLFESGAILKYLALKFGRFYPADPRAQARVDEWLFWQVGGFGPMLGQHNHFVRYAPEKIPYAIKRYTNEAHRLFRVLDEQLARQHEAGAQFVAGDYSIADIAIFGWSNSYRNYEATGDEFPHWWRWHQSIAGRPTVERALAIRQAPEKVVDLATDAEAKKVLFNQR